MNTIATIATIGTTNNRMLLYNNYNECKPFNSKDLRGCSIEQARLRLYVKVIELSLHEKLYGVRVLLVSVKLLLCSRTIELLVCYPRSFCPQFTRF